MRKEGGRKERRRKGRWVGIDSRNRLETVHISIAFPSLITRERHPPPPPTPSFSSLLHSGQLALATNLQAFNINATRYIPSNPTVVSPVSAFLFLSSSLSLSLSLSVSVRAVGFGDESIFVRRTGFIRQSRGMILSFSLCFSLPVPL